MQTAKHIIISAHYLHILCPGRRLRTICVKAKFFESKGHVLYRELTLYSSINVESYALIARLGCRHHSPGGKST